jgi:8-oxo-dGTP pyrophosphatase MutT (NUDIX family)
MKNTGIHVTAAVAIIRCEHPVTSYLLLRRASHPDDPWSGHFAFPGGRKELSDKTLLDTCLRETKEETGIELQVSQLVQTLSPEPAGQNFQHLLWVQPFLFSLPNRPELSLNTSEIVDSAWVSLKNFTEPANHSETEMLPGRLFPTFPLQDYFLWGFTYKLLGKTVEL